MPDTTEPRPQEWLRLAADIGGTFTDIALTLGDGTVAIGKVP